jgi:hypothetical protein
MWLEAGGWRYVQDWWLEMWLGMVDWRYGRSSGLEMWLGLVDLRRGKKLWILQNMWPGAVNSKCVLVRNNAF